MNLVFRGPSEVELPTIVRRRIFFRVALQRSIARRLRALCRRICFSLDQPFDFVLIPDPAKAERKAEELHRDDLGLSYYSWRRDRSGAADRRAGDIGAADATAVCRKLPRLMQQLRHQSQP